MAARYWLVWACLFGSSGLLLASPVDHGLVLWLDAGDSQTIARDADGTIEVWRDKSSQGNHARQVVPGSRPCYFPEGLQGRPCVRFDGDDFLNLGQPASLDFRPGAPFTVFAVARVAVQDSGTFLAQGGGGAGERAYQFYVAPGRRGTIAYGVMQEQQGRTVETEITAWVCDGKQTEVTVNGTASYSFRAGQGTSDVDVLVGARRQNADNTGAYFPLKGDLAELLVYDRVLTAEELQQVGGYLKTKYGLEAVYTDANDLEKLVGVLATPEAAAHLDGLAGALSRNPELAARAIRELLKEHPEADSLTAELLLRMAQKNQLAPPLAGLAATFFDHEDPFVGGMAEWAIAMQVGSENNGQAATWPKPEPPDWFAVWSGLPQAFRIQADWVRQAVALGIHRDPAKLRESVSGMIERAERMLEDRAGDARTAQDLLELRGLLDKSVTMPVDLADHRRLWIEARRCMRKIALSDPAVDFPGVVFVKQFAPHTVRNITRSYAWKHKPGGDICIVPDLQTGEGVREILQGRLGPGYVWGLDLWWDADRVVFGYARQENWPPAVDTANYAIEGTNVFQLRQQHEPLHIFEAPLDGSAPRQLTDDPYWSDFEPTYCANGDVVFASDRCGRSAECGNDTYDHTNPNLYVMAGDGSQLRKWTDSKDIDRYPHSLDDGRIAYTHWEYQERHFMEVHALWTARPDGTMSDALFKHHLPAPCGLRDTRSIPNSGKLVSIATGHHTFAYGPVVIVDPSKGMNNDAGLEIVTPGVKPQEGPMAGKPVADGGVRDQGGLYQTPWALSEKSFLASYSYARPDCTAPAGADSNGFGLYFIDTYGNRELIHRDPLLSCVFPIPLQQRRRPPLVPEMTVAVDGEQELGNAPYSGECSDGQHGYATCYVADVYDGLEDVPRGTVKYLRISQHIGWPFDATRGQMDYIPGNAGSRQVGFQSWSPVRVIGTVPVEADGSAAFHMPADTAVYFQALDDRQMEIRRMRSVVSLKAGEVRGCTGCHESRAWTSAPTRGMPLAMLREPSRPSPPAWGADRLIGYEWLIQPILNQHCVRCHGLDHPEGGLDFTATRTADGLYQSFHTMFGQLAGQGGAGAVLVSCSDRFSNSDVTRIKQFGSHKSRLVQVLLDDALHRDEVQLDPQEWISLVTWVDANAPYYDGFINKRPEAGGTPCRVPLKP